MGRVVGCCLSLKPRLAPVRQGLRSGAMPKNPAQQICWAGLGRGGLREGPGLWDGVQSAS